MNKIIRLVDRTRTVTDWKCPRARYWGYEYLGRGVTKSSTSLELFIGTTVHDALAAIATGGIDIDEIARAAFKQVYEEIIVSAGGVIQTDVEDFAKEQGTLAEGMIRGFHKHVWPRLMTQYPKIVAVEREMEYQLAEGFVFMSRPDLIVEDSSGELVYLEYKTTSSKKESWVNSWETAVQLHSSILAAEQTLGKRPAYVQIIGLYKGYESYGKQSSPFCYCYKKNGNPPFTVDQIQYEYKAGFKRYPTWELVGGVKAWVDSMPENVLADQFPLTAPIMVNDELVDRFFQQRLIREKQISAGLEDIAKYEQALAPRVVEYELDTVFPQHFDQCVPSFGYSCQFKKLCHGGVQNPLTEGFELREPHHSRELEEFNAKS